VVLFGVRVVKRLENIVLVGGGNRHAFIQYDRLY